MLFLSRVASRRGRNPKLRRAFIKGFTPNRVRNNLSGEDLSHTASVNLA